MAIELESLLPPAERQPARASWLGGAVTAADRALFTERLALLLETGMTLHVALETLREQTPNPRFAEIIAAITAEVVTGKPLSVALAQHRALFPGAYISLVAAAETGGFLFQVLKQIVDMEDKQEKLRSTLRGAATYPAFLSLFSIAVVVFVLVVVFPRFADLFNDIRDQLPLSTLILMALSDVMRQYWHLILAGIGAAGFLLVRWVKQPEGAAAIDRLKLRLPFVRDLFMQIYMARIMRVMGTSLANGVSVIDTLVACRDIVSNREFRAFLDRVEAGVIEGRGFASTFMDEPRIPMMVRQMIATGDASGNLALVMARIADFYERELVKKIHTLTRLAEPLLLLVMGVVVGLIVSSLILPIFKLSSAVH